MKTFMTRLRDAAERGDPFATWYLPRCENPTPRAHHEVRDAIPEERRAALLQFWRAECALQDDPVMQELVALHELDGDLHRRKYAWMYPFQDAMRAGFGYVHGWRPGRRFNPALLLTGKMHGRAEPLDYSHEVLDHPDFFKQDRWPACVVAHTYAHFSKVDAWGRESGLAIRWCPDPFASWYYPGWAAMFAVTPPDRHEWDEYYWRHEGARVKFSGHEVRPGGVKLWQDRLAGRGVASLGLGNSQLERHPGAPASG